MGGITAVMAWTSLIKTISTNLTSNTSKDCNNKCINSNNNTIWAMAVRAINIIIMMMKAYREQSKLV